MAIDVTLKSRRKVTEERNKENMQEEDEKFLPEDVWGGEVAKEGGFGYSG